MVDKKEEKESMWLKIAVGGIERTTCLHSLGESERGLVDSPSLRTSLFFVPRSRVGA